VFHHAALSFLKQEPGYAHWLSLRRFAAQSSQIVAKTAAVSDSSEILREQAGYSETLMHRKRLTIDKECVY
jgi:hypothetical protein